MSQNISRRIFLKSATVGAMGVASIGVLGACSPRDNQTEESSSEPEIKIPTSPVDGKYMTKSMGHEDYINVVTEFRGGAIKSCKVVSHRETIGVGNYACERIPAAIVASQSIKVPDIRGCSTSSYAVKKAVEEAIRISGHDINKFSAVVPEPDNNTNEEKNVDVVIMGAGTAGLVCAARLLDKGYSVLVVEKRGIPGGSMAMTYSGVIASGTKTNDNYNVDNKTPEIYTSVDTMLSVMSTMIIPEHDRFNGTQPYQKQAYTALGDLSEWFKDIGIGFCTIGAFEGASKYGNMLYLAPGCYMGGAGYAMMALASYITRHPNGEILYMAKVTDLIQDPTSKQVSGLKAVGLKSDDSENGYKLTANAKAVVLASGGFARNKEMLTEYYPEHKDYFFNCASTSTGEGVLLGLDAGSKMECLNRKLPGYLSSTSYFELALIHHSTPGIMVNSTGNNVGNIISDNHGKMAAAAMDKSHGNRFYYVFDESSVPSTKNFLDYAFNTYESMFNRDEVIHYKSVADAASELTLPGLQAAIDANNSAALSGEPDEFGRKVCPFIDTRNGIYLISVIPTFYLTSAGICIDTEGHVLTDSYVVDGKNTVIPGLYACGDVTGSAEEKDGKHYGMGFDIALGYGHTVAETIKNDGIA